MLTNEQQFVIELLRKSFGTGGITSPTGRLDSQEIAQLINRNGILPTVFAALNAFPEAQVILQLVYYATLSQNVNQRHEGKRVIVALRNAGMRVVPCKGWETCALYPNSFMRQMTDVDVLVNPYDYEVILREMLSLGFTPDEGESARKHDVYFKGPVTVEVHKRLTDDSGAIRAWEAGMWERAVTDDEGMLHMSPEDVYVFHFVHMRRDFGNGWFALRRVVEAWLLDRQRENLDMDYINREFDDMGISRFHERMVWLGKVCMGEEPMDSDAELLLIHAFDCGMFGNGVSYKAGRIASLTNGGEKVGRSRSVMAAIFLPYARMKAQFPVLERWPVLLPACWLKRIVHYLTNGKLGEYRSKLDYRGVTDADVEHMRRVFRAGGC